jgi:hypothetical protein
VLLSAAAQAPRADPGRAVEKPSCTDGNDWNLGMSRVWLQNVSNGQHLPCRTGDVQHKSSEFRNIMKNTVVSLNMTEQDGTILQA